MTSSFSESGAPSPIPQPKTILKIAFPLMAGLLLEQLIGLTDALFLGRYGEAELAAVGVASIYVLLIMMLGFGYGIGAQSLMSRANGARDLPQVGVVFRQSALFMAVAALAVMIISWIALEPIFSRLINDADVRDAAISYVFWRTIALPIAYLTILGRSFFVAVLRPRVITVMSLVMVTVNCALNAVLIFGLGPFPELGIAGAAIASAVSEVAALAVLLLGLARLDGWWARCFGKLSDWRPHLAVQSEIFALGRWLMLQEAAAFGVWLYFFIAVENAGGERALAFSNIVRQLGAILFLFVHAFGSAAGTIAANLAGARRSELIEPAVLLSGKLCLAVIFPIFVIFALFPKFVLGLLTDMPELIDAAVPSYYVMAVSYLLTVPSYMGFFVIGALGYAKESLKLTLASAAIYGTYIWVLDRFEPSTAVYWTSDTVYGFALGIGVALVWPKARRQKFVAK